MRRIAKRGGLILLGACAPAVAAKPTGATAVSCLPVDSTVTMTLDRLKSNVTTSDPMTRELFDSLQITAMRANDVSYMTDERTCAKAVTALNTLWNDQASTQVRVYKVGADYLVEDPSRDAQGGEYRGLQVFDRRWIYKSTYLTF